MTTSAIIIMIWMHWLKWSGTMCDMLQCFLFYDYLWKKVQTKAVAVEHVTLWWQGRLTIEDVTRKLVKKYNTCMLLVGSVTYLSVYQLLTLHMQFFVNDLSVRASCTIVYASCFNTLYYYCTLLLCHSCTSITIYVYLTVLLYSLMTVTTIAIGKKKK